MKIELNRKEYTYMPCLNRPKCVNCAWRVLSADLCVQFCRQGYNLQTVKITPSIFHL